MTVLKVKDNTTTFTAAEAFPSYLFCYKITPILYFHCKIFPHKQHHQVNVSCL